MTIYEGVFLTITLVWLAEFVIFRNSPSAQGGRLEKKSFPIILVSVLSAVFVSLIMREWQVGIVFSKGLWWFGVLLYASGVFLRYWGILHLKEQFTRDVSVREGDRLVSTGPYKVLRHPLYTGLFFIILGFCLGVGNVWTALICGTILVFALLHRIHIEEAMLIEAHGERYKQWCQSRYRLVPFVY
ncbi:methyltransferase family protein [Halobacillus mangrovi]|uniref:Isoprenylcysteine carboxyl methyltransferase n=1 Tax=Halobacillus mangrovi TaxID=402384 RepID=A0A1W5ZZY0_9BACI|nr:isoprenylcysteine carboxylmethyltransferase family protein [Halobacillus mangrovi]ARI78916.1 isoprenylcysteine carboxyl methyltransferase [Halobacillus mangrovi]